MIINTKDVVLISEKDTKTKNTFYELAVLNNAKTKFIALKNMFDNTQVKRVDEHKDIFQYSFFDYDIQRNKRKLVIHNLQEILKLYNGHLLSGKADDMVEYLSYYISYLDETLDYNVLKKLNDNMLKLQKREKEQSKDLSM